MCIMESTTNAVSWTRGDETHGRPRLYAVIDACSSCAAIPSRKRLEKTDSSHGPSTSDRGIQYELVRTIMFAAVETNDLPDFFAVVEDGVDPVEKDGAVWG